MKEEPTFAQQLISMQDIKKQVVETTLLTLFGVCFVIASIYGFISKLIELK